MERLFLKTAPVGQKTIDDIYAGLNRRVASGERGVCPVDLTTVFLRLCQSQSCGKCTACRIGLGRIVELLEKILAGRGKPEDLELILTTAGVVADSADCAIGFEAAEMVLGGIEAYRKDFDANVNQGTCIAVNQAVRCKWNCPAHVDIPGYIALCGQGRYADAIRIIRKNNPLPATCALICEFPCEEFCRRGIIDSPVNIRVIKRAVIDRVGEIPPPLCAPSTGKSVAVVGGGPAGLTAAYFLTRMGHKVTIYEKRRRLGGMLRYGIPLYRLPDRFLDNDINEILATGVESIMEVEIGSDVPFDELREKYDSVLVTIGAHGGKRLGIPGDDSKGVLSAVKLLSDMGDGMPPEFSGKKVVVIGGGNVAMDAARSAIRLGARSVYCVYRRRIEDMGALPEEIEGAVAEGVEIVTLRAPVRVESRGGEVEALIVQPQIMGEYRGGRPVPRKANQSEERIDCDIVIAAIGQAIESEYFSKCGIPIRDDMIQTQLSCAIPEMPGVFAGGDCTFGPATVIRAIEAGRVCAANIDHYLGFSHKIETRVKIPPAPRGQHGLLGRVASTNREVMARKNDFDLIEQPISDEEMLQECSRCLRCDHRGLGGLKDGRDFRW